MLELGATITRSIVKKITFRLDETASVEGSSDSCDDKIGQCWNGRERNVRNYSTKLGGSNSEHSLGKQEGQKSVTKFLIQGISGNWT